MFGWTGADSGGVDSRRNFPKRDRRHGRGPKCLRRERRQVHRDQSRCQVFGGARAWKEFCREAARRRSIRAVVHAGPTSAGNSNDGPAVGTPLPASWIDAQITHWSWAICLTGFAGCPASSVAAIDDGAASWTRSAGSALFVPGTCTWPNVSANCTASANRAHQAPNRRFARVQRIATVPNTALHSEPADRAPDDM
jgi:hypothetical protein